MNFWDSIKQFFSNLGHTVLAEIITALPAAQQILLQAITALVDAAIAYVEAKYATQVTSLKEMKVEEVTPEMKLALDNQRHNDAFNYIKEEMAKEGSSYPSVPDSLLHCWIEVAVQKAKRVSEGNHGIVS